MISLDAMMKFVAGPNCDASTLSSGDQLSTALSSAGLGSLVLSSGVGKGKVKIKTEKGDHKKVSESKTTGEKKKIVKNTRFVPPKSANKPPISETVSNLPKSKTDDAKAILRDLATFKSKHKPNLRKGHTKQPKPAPHSVTIKPEAIQIVDNQKTESNFVKPVSDENGEFVQDALTNDVNEDTIANVTSDKENSEMPAHLGKETYECTQCRKTFVYLKRLIAHQLKGSCNVNVYECSQCKIKLKNARSLQRHVKHVHEKPLYQCVECSKIFTTNKTVQRHLKNHHEHIPCKFCEKVLKNKNTLRVHVQSCKLKKATMNLEAATNETNQIDEGSENNEKVKNVKEEGGNNKTIDYNRKCERCEKTFLSRGGYSKHMKSHRLADQNKTLKDVITLKEAEVEMFVLKNDIEKVDIEFIDET